MAIPGVTTLIKDRFYSVSRQDAPVGPRIVAIARRTTADGTGGISDLDVFRCTNESDVITAFGSGSDAHRAYVELVSAGAERIFLVPLPSNTVFNHSTAALTSGGVSIFDDAFNAAEAALPDIIVPWGRGGHPTEFESPATPANDLDASSFGFFADNSATPANNWGYKIATAVKSISQNIHPCIAVMGIKPYVGTSERMTPGQVTTHMALTNLPNRDTGDSFKEIGPYLTVIATELKPLNYSVGGSDVGYTNGATALAATMSRIPSYSSVVNKPAYNIQTLRYAPTRTQQATLGEKGVNSLIINFNKVPVFGEGLTFAQSTSDYTRLSTKRIIDEATQVVRQVCQKFIGEPSNIQVRNSMETAITSGLRGMQLMGALLGSDFTITYIPNQNKAIVDLVLTPAFELRTIEVQIAINL